MSKALGRSKKPYVRCIDGELQISEKAVVFWMKPSDEVAYAAMLSKPESLRSERAGLIGGHEMRELVQVG